MRLYENISRSGVTFTSSELEEVEATLKILLEATSWIDWWLFTTYSLVKATFFLAREDSDCDFQDQVGLVVKFCALEM